MKIFPTIFKPDIERAVENNFGAIDLRPRLQVHGDALADILDRLAIDRKAERDKQDRLRADMDASVAAEAEIERLVKAYSAALESLA